MSKHPSELLGPNDPPTFSVEHEDGLSPLLLTCDHAGNRLPARLGNLGLPESELARHIAWDLGCAALSQRLAQRLDAFLIMQSYSRLVIDVNRPPGTAESIVSMSESTPIPGNKNLSEHERQARVSEVFEPYHARLREQLDRRLAAGQATILVAMHSFTPTFLGVARPWHVGVLYGRDVRLGSALLTALRRDAALVVGDNEPYAVSDETDYTLLVHGEQRGIPHVELELRQDLIASERGQEEWAERLAVLLQNVVCSAFPA